ncbi:MAG TPA: hypothetical protein VFY22_04390 [Hydrogenophaga sp.]|nr:hypothetical protein [Hydrogenophaga sp.]
MNQLLPEWQFQERHERWLPGITAERTFAAVVPALQVEDPLIERAIALREWPGRLLQRMGVGGARLPTQAFGYHSFTPLGTVPDREVAYGLVGQFWQLDYGLIPVADTQAFERVQNEPKLVLNVCVEPEAGGCRLVTRTRVHCPNEALRRRFVPYWYVIRPVSGLIRRRLLAQIHRTSLDIL